MRILTACSRVLHGHDGSLPGRRNLPDREDLAKGKFGVETTSEEPFVESEWFAPSSLVATKLEKKVQREYAAKSYELAQKEQAAA